MGKRLVKVNPLDGNSKRAFFHRKKNGYPEEYYLLLYLKLFGINLVTSRRNSLQRCLSVLFALMFHLVYIDCVLTYLSYMWQLPDDKLFMSSIFNVTTVLCLWYALLFKQKHIKRFLNTFNRFSCNLNPKKCYIFNNTAIITLSFYTIPFFYALAAVSSSNEFQMKMIYFWNFEELTFSVTALYYAREVCNSLINHVFCGIITILYFSTCYKIIKIIKNVRAKIEMSVEESNSGLLPVSFLLPYLRTLDMIEELDEVFTSSIFIATVSNGISLFTLMAIFFMSREEALSPYAVLQMVMFFITSGVYLTLTILIASQVPLEVDKNVKCFTKLVEKYILESSTFPLDKQQLTLIKGVIKRPVTTLSGCHIVYFTRHVLITILGALITYGLLIMKMK